MAPITGATLRERYRALLARQQARAFLAFYAEHGYLPWNTGPKRA